MNPTSLLLPLAVFVGIYAAIAGHRFTVSVLRARPARRQGVMLNLARRAAPPILGGLIVLIGGVALGASGSGTAAALLIAGGAAYGLQRGLAELGMGDWRATAIRAALSLGLTLGVIWLLSGP